MLIKFHQISPKIGGRAPPVQPPTFMAIAEMISAGGLLDAGAGLIGAQMLEPRWVGGGRKPLIRDEARPGASARDHAVCWIDRSEGPANRSTFQEGLSELRAQPWE